MCPECGGVEGAGLLTAEDTWEQAADGTRSGQKGCALSNELIQHAQCSKTFLFKDQGRVGPG